jgi:hypothetical protein
MAAIQQTQSLKASSCLIPNQLCAKAGMSVISVSPKNLVFNGPFCLLVVPTIYWMVGVTNYEKCVGRGTSEK